MPANCSRPGRRDESRLCRIKPGMRDHDVVGVAVEAVFNGGGEQGIYLCSSNPSDAAPGTVVPIGGTIH